MSDHGNTGVDLSSSHFIVTLVSVLTKSGDKRGEGGNGEGREGEGKRKGRQGKNN